MIKSHLRTCVYIYIRQLSSFRVPTLWFIDPTVATCHIQYTFLSLRQFVKSAMFVRYENGRRPLLGAQSINIESFFNTCTAGVSVAIIGPTYISVQYSLTHVLQEILSPLLVQPSLVCNIL